MQSSPAVRTDESRMPAVTFKRLAPAIAAAVLVAHFMLAVLSKRNESTTSDEIAHVTGGVAYWKFNDYRLQPENGNLPQRWAALPAYLAHAKFPTLDQDYWRTSDVWVMGHEFFYETGEDHFPRLMAARAMIALFSVATGALVFLWSRTLFGDAAGVFSVVLYGFSPNFLAHGALATSDVCMVFFFLASLGAWWRHLHDGRRRTAVLSLLAFGLACVAKFSAVLLLPMFAILGVAAVVSAEPLHIAGRIYSTRSGKVRALVFTSIAHAAAAIFVIWVFYGFRYSAFNPAVPSASQFIRRWDLIDANIGLQGKIVHVLATLHALPEAFLYGYAYVIESTQSRAAFLNGAYSFIGWRRFFPWAFLLKSTIPVLVLTAAVPLLMLWRWLKPVTPKSPAPAAAVKPSVSAADAVKRAGRALYRALPLVVLFVVYGAFSLTTHLNIGHRHILPLYPVIFIGAGALLAKPTRRSPRVWLAVTCGIGQVAAAGQIWPNYIAYFNPLYGGPSEAYYHLVDSSLDWGQDLPGLKQWLAQNRPEAAPVYLSYFGTGEPAYYGIHARRLVMVNGFKIRQPLARLEPGIYCISVTCLQQVYNPYRGRWTAEHEKEYQKLRALEPAFLDYAEHPEHRADWEKQITTKAWDAVQERYEQLRFARLCQLLRNRRPDAQIGYSINVYTVTGADLARFEHPSTTSDQLGHSATRP